MLSGKRKNPQWVHPTWLHTWVTPYLIHMCTWAPDTNSQPIYSSPLSNLVWIDPFDSWSLVNKQKCLWFLYSQISTSAQGISNRENLDGITIDFSFEFMKLSLNEICSNTLQVTGCGCLLLEKAAALGKVYLFSWSVAGSFIVLDFVLLLGEESPESVTGSGWHPPRKVLSPGQTHSALPLGAALEHGQIEGYEDLLVFLDFFGYENIYNKIIQINKVHLQQSQICLSPRSFPVLPYQGFLFHQAHASSLSHFPPVTSFQHKHRAFGILFTWWGKNMDIALEAYKMNK